MASKTDIGNFALSHLAISTFVANIDSDQGKEARILRKWWDIALAFSLRDTDWNWNRRYQSLAQLEGTVPAHWTYKYAYPADGIAIRALMPPGIRLPLLAQRIPYEIASETVEGSDIRVIYTDLINAVARYSKNIVDPTLFDSVFTIAHSYLLASLIAMPLSIKPQIATYARDMYVSMKAKAEADNFNESQDGTLPWDNELDSVRNG